MPWPPPFSQSDLRDAIAVATCWADTLRALGYEVKGANHRTVQRWAAIWGISTDHFDPNLARRRASKARAIPLEAALVENSSYPRGALKERLFAAGLKQRECEICGQGELWHGSRMSLVLDTSTACPMTTGLRTCGSSARIARRRLRPAAAAICLANESVLGAANRLRLGTSDIGTALKPAGGRCLVTDCAECPSWTGGRWTDRRMNSCSSTSTR